MPRINSTLESFIESWNNHALSTENNLTPNQLFIRGAIQQNLTPFFPSTSGPGSRGSSGLPSTSNHVSVPLISFTPCPLLYRDVTSRLDPLD